MRAVRRWAAILVLAVATGFVLSQVFGGPVGYVIVSGRSMEPLLHTHDLALVVRRGSYGQGDVVAFRVPESDPAAGSVVIHRIVGGSSRDGYVTQGDNRDGRDPWRPVSEDVVGRMAFHVPHLGRIPAFLASPLGMALAAALVCFLLVARTPQRDPAEPEPAPAPASPERALDASPPSPVRDVARGPVKARPLVLAGGLLAGATALALVALARRRAVDEENGR